MREVESCSLRSLHAHGSSTETNERDFPLQFLSGEGNGGEHVTQFLLNIHSQRQFLGRERREGKGEGEGERELPSCLLESQVDLENVVPGEETL